MDQCYRDVLEFHRKLTPQLIGTTPKVPSDEIARLRMRLVREEYRELDAALWNEDLPCIADSIVDEIYVLIGMAISFGIDIRPVWAAVHAANLAKEGGPIREDGKVCKPPGWQAPNIAAILARQPPITEEP